MKFNVQEQQQNIHFYPVLSDAWMIVKTNQLVPWKLYKKINDDYEYVTEHQTLNDVCDAGKLLR
jgi:hypothetical protein